MSSFFPFLDLIYFFLFFFLIYHLPFTLLLLLFASFRTSVSCWSFTSSDSKYLQVSRTLLSILSELCDVVIWMVSVLLISDSPRYFTKPLGVVCAPPPGRQSTLFGKFFFFVLFTIIPNPGARRINLFVSQNPREFYASHSQGRISCLCI